jgi:hypothetical protein
VVRRQSALAPNGIDEASAWIKAVDEKAPTIGRLSDGAFTVAGPADNRARLPKRCDEEAVLKATGRLL